MSPDTKPHPHLIYKWLFGMCLGLFLPYLALHAQSSPGVNEPISRFLEKGIFDPADITEDALYAAVEAAYVQEHDPVKKSQLAEKWLLLKWGRLWEADAEMPAEQVLVGNILPAYAMPSENWQWSHDVPAPGRSMSLPAEHFNRVHSSPFEKGISRHGFRGTFPYILPANGRLLQYVYVPANQHPETIQLQIETSYLSSAPQRPVIVKAYWTQSAVSLPDSENRPDNFWAGTVPTGEGWHLLSVDLMDIGLCGQNRTIRGIEYIANGGTVWFGPTVLRRPQVEIRGTRPYNVLAVEEPMQFDLTVHNFSSIPERYTLDMTMTDYDGNILRQAVYHLNVPAKSHWSQPLVLAPGSVRYVVFEYALSRGNELLMRGHSAAARIEPNLTGRRDDSAFGMMYWEQPGQEIVDLYERLGVKLIGIFPELHRLHRFDPNAFTIMPMIWSLPERDSPEAQKLRQTIQPYLQAGHTIFSNFWETDLRVPARIFAAGMQNFSAIVKAVEPAAMVGIGGMAWFNVAYVHQLFQAFRIGSDSTTPVDFIAAMSYNTPTPPEFSGLVNETAALKTLLQQHESAHTELWNVEWAYFENQNVGDDVWLNTGVPRHLIAPYTIRHHLTGFGAGIDRMMPGTLIYAGRTPLSKNYGHSMTLGRSSMMRYDLTPLPMLPAYATMTRLLEGKTYRANLSPHPNVLCQVYQSSENADTDPVLAIWSVLGREQIAVPLFSSDHNDQVTIVTMIGEERQQRTHQGRLQLSVSPEPLYVLLPADYQIEETTHASLTTDVLFDTIPEALELSPDQTQHVTLTYRITNPGRQAFQGTLHLSNPNWLSILHTDIHYPDDTQRQLAELMLPKSPAPAATDIEFWLGREHTVEVTYEVEIPAKIPRQTYYEQVALTSQPWFTIVANISTNDGIIAQASTPAHVRSPLEITLRPILKTAADRHNPHIQVQVTNHSPVERRGTLERKTPPHLHIEPWNASFSIPAGETRTYTFELSGGDGYVREYDLETVDARFQRITSHIVLQSSDKARLDHYRKKDGYHFSFGVGEGYVIEALLKDEQGFETRQSRGFAFRPAVRATRPVQIDGYVDEWHNAVPLFVHPEGRLSGLTFFAKEYGDEMQWTGLDDFSAAWQMMWNDAYLYMAIRTWDNHIQPYTPLGAFWNGDTVTFQIDPRPDATDAAPLPATRDLWDIHTFEMALSEHEPVIRRQHPTHRHPAGLVDTIRIAAQQTPDGLLYEVAVPWEELAPLSPENSDWIGFSLVFNEDDGDGRETQINWFGGSGGNGLAREPRLMGDVHFCR